MPPDSKIKFISQHDERLPADWRERSCGIASLTMVIGYYLNGSSADATVDKILAKGLEINAYLANIGWRHKELAKIAESFGLTAYNRDLPLLNNPEKAWQEFLTDLEQGPLVVSIRKNFSTDRSVGSHLIVVEKIANDLVHILDPDEKEEATGNYTVPIETLKNGWKKLYIVVRNKA